MEIKWNLCSNEQPKKDGYYLAVCSMEGDPDWLYGVGEMSYVADEEGGWNCNRVFNRETGECKIHNSSRITTVYAWSDCIKAIHEEIKEMKKR